MDEYIRKIVAEAPPLSDEQARKIAGLFDIEHRRAQDRAERRPYTAGASEGVKHLCSVVLCCRDRCTGGQGESRSKPERRRSSES